MPNVSQFPLERRRSSRINSLDGLRAIAVTLVLFDHLCISGALPFRQTIIDFGNLGVRIFFVISGFLITKLLLNEKNVIGHISLSGFYIRRVFRLLPVLACFLGGTCLVLVLTHRTPPLTDLLTVLFFNADMRRPAAVDFMHLWSLSVEEKFYLLWPLLLVLTNRRRAFGVAVAVVLVVPLIRVYAFFHGASYDAQMGPFYASADTLAAGCCLALLRPFLHRTKTWPRVIHSRWIWGLVPVVLAIAALHATGLLFWLFGITAMNIALAVLLDALVTRPQGSVGTLLSHPVLTTLGLWSYGIYLFQQPFVFHPKVPFLGRFPWDVVAPLGLAAAAYYLVEKPAQVYGRRVAARLTGGPNAVTEISISIAAVTPLQETASFKAAAGSK